MDSLETRGIKYTIWYSLRHTVRGGGQPAKYDARMSDIDGERNLSALGAYEVRNLLKYIPLLNNT
jgi:hypothetical protein